MKLHEASDALDAAGLIEAARDVDIIVADRLTAGPGEIFLKLPKLRAFVRCAVDIRNVDVEAASAAGVLVTRAGPGFIQSVAELALGFMVDLSRGVSRATADYHAGRKPEVIMGRQLAGSRLGIIGYGSIGRYLADIAKVTQDQKLAELHCVRVDEIAASSRIPYVAVYRASDLLARARQLIEETGALPYEKLLAAAQPTAASCG